MWYLGKNLKRINDQEKTIFLQECDGNGEKENQIILLQKEKQMRLV